ncbi:MAG: hypothetical protein WAN76_19800 [Candidatus Sulfotelmatobacter sp.]
MSVPKHGQVKTTTWKPAHAKAHLSKMVASASEVRDYHGGAEGADYQTSSTGTTGDSDSQGATEY